MMTSQLVVWTFSTIQAIVVPRYLGPALSGQVRLAISLWAIGGIVIALGTQRFLALEIARNRRDGLACVGPTVVIRTCMFALCASALGAYVALTTDDAIFVGIMILVAAQTLVTTWAETLETAFIGLERMATPALTRAVSKVGLTLGVLAVIWFGGDIHAILGVGVAAALVGLALALWRFRDVGRVHLRGWRTHAPHVVKRSLPFMMGGAALVLYRQIDTVVISWLADDEDVGWYGTADVLAGSLLFPAIVLTGAIFPTLGRLHAQDPPELAALVRRTFSSLIIVGVPIGLGTMLIAPTFAPLLYGEEFRETGDVLAVLGPVVILSYGTMLFGVLAQATGRVQLWVWVLSISALLTIPLDLVLVPWSHDRFGNGAIGGALAYVVTETMQFAIGLLTVARILARRHVLWRTLRVLAAGGVMFLVGWPLRHVFPAIPVIVCATVYVPLVFAFRVVTDDERRIIGSALDRFGIRAGRSN